MIVYNINKNLEGHKTPDIYVKVVPSGWTGMHYIIEEEVETSKFQIFLVNADELYKYLKSDANQGGIKEEDITHYLAASTDVADGNN